MSDELTNEQICDICDTLNEMAHLGFKDWTFKKRQDQLVFYSDTQLCDKAALVTPLHPDTARMVVGWSSPVATQQDTFEAGLEAAIRVILSPTHDGDYYEMVLRIRALRPQRSKS